MKLATKPVIVAALALLALGGGVAYATIPDNQGVIHACYKTQNGQLRVIGSGSCGPSENALSWSQTGPSGPQGPQGPAGPKGDAGPPGPPGNDSTKTVAGAINPDGTSQFATDDFTSQRLDTGHYRIDFAPGTFASVPDIVIMPLGLALGISGTTMSALGNGGFRVEYYTVSTQPDQLTDALVTFIATPFTQG